MAILGVLTIPWLVKLQNLASVGDYSPQKDLGAAYVFEDLYANLTEVNILPPICCLVCIQHINKPAYNSCIIHNNSLTPLKFSLGIGVKQNLEERVSDVLDRKLTKRIKII